MVCVVKKSFLSPAGDVRVWDGLRMPLPHAHYLRALARNRRVPSLKQAATFVPVAAFIPSGFYKGSFRKGALRRGVLYTGAGSAS
jgi:hypothetical protein